MPRKIKVLAIDDEAMNLDILTEYLTQFGYEVMAARDGAAGLIALEQNPDVDVVLLDRMMPNLNGIEVLKKIKSDARFHEIPVIMQTAAATHEQMLQGIQAGAYYYLTKPYDEAVLLGIVRSALEDARKKQETKAAVLKNKYVLGLMDQARFRYQTIAEAQNLAYFIANCFPEPDKVIFGLSELLINAVEHGNLGIGYNEKTKLILQGAWHDEVQRRLNLPEYQHRYVHVSFDVVENVYTVAIVDQGDGFDWKKYLDIHPDRATDPHGRGIAISRMISFNEIAYLGCGNEVICTVVG